MTKEADLEKRVRVLEEFHAEIRGGRKILLWIASLVGATVGAVLAYWGLSGSTQ